jgi:hypothetical protein
MILKPYLELLFFLCCYLLHYHFLCHFLCFNFLFSFSTFFCIFWEREPLFRNTERCMDDSFKIQIHFPQFTCDVEGVVCVGESTSSIVKTAKLIYTFGGYLGKMTCFHPFCVYCFLFSVWNISVADGSAICIPLLFTCLRSVSVHRLRYSFLNFTLEVFVPNRKGWSPASLTQLDNMYNCGYLFSPALCGIMRSRDVSFLHPSHSPPFHPSYSTHPSHFWLSLLAALQRDEPEWSRPRRSVHSQIYDQRLPDDVNLHCSLFSH